MFYYPSQAAEENLKIVLRAVGGRWEPEFTRAVVDNFVIFPNMIYRRSDSANTCYYIGAETQPLEIIASAALLLHNCPALFDFWAFNHGDFLA